MVLETPKNTLFPQSIIAFNFCLQFPDFISPLDDNNLINFGKAIIEIFLFRLFITFNISKNLLKIIIFKS